MQGSPVMQAERQTPPAPARRFPGAEHGASRHRLEGRLPAGVQVPDLPSSSGAARLSQGSSAKCGRQQPPSRWGLGIQ